MSTAIFDLRAITAGKSRRAKGLSDDVFRSHNEVRVLFLVSKYRRSWGGSIDPNSRVEGDHPAPAERFTENCWGLLDRIDELA